MSHFLRRTLFTAQGLVPRKLILIYPEHRNRITEALARRIQKELKQAHLNAMETDKLIDSSQVPYTIVITRRTLEDGVLELQHYNPKIKEEEEVDDTCPINQEELPASRANPEAMIVKDKSSNSVKFLVGTNPTDQHELIATVTLAQIRDIQEKLSGKVPTRIERHRSDRRDDLETVVRFRLISQNHPQGKWVRENELDKPRYDQVRRDYLAKLKFKRSLKTYRFILNKCPSWKRLV